MQYLKHGYGYFSEINLATKNAAPAASAPIKTVFNAPIKGFSAVNLVFT